MVPLPCVYVPLGVKFHVMDITAAEAANVAAVNMLDAGPAP
jgi:hypothetical protein